MKKLSIGLALLATIFLAGCSDTTVNSSEKSPLDSFAACITQRGAQMYGTEWCSHCKNQKALFGKSFKKVAYTDCDKSKGACQIAGITGYPTWVFADKSRLSGTQSLEVLTEKTGCQLPSK